MAASNKLAVKGARVHAKLQCAANNKIRQHHSSTASAYQRDVAQFVQAYGGTIPCSADQLIAYIVELSGQVSPATVVRRCMAIQDAHVRNNHVSPTDDPRIREALRWMAAGHLPRNLLGKSRRSGPPPSRSRMTLRVVRPITRELLLRMLDTHIGSVTGDTRDKLILLLGYAGLKRGAMCKLNIDDLSFGEDAVSVTIGARPPLVFPYTADPLCVANALFGWVARDDWQVESGPLLPRLTRTGEPTVHRLDSAYVSKIVKERLRACGITDVSVYSAESLRLGTKLEAETEDADGPG